jgi:hypothetical protein
MSVTIRTRANGQEHDELYATEREGRAALERNLQQHRADGHMVTPNGSRTLFTVKDENGVVIQESEIVPSG